MNIADRNSKDLAEERTLRVTECSLRHRRQIEGFIGEQFAQTTKINLRIG